MINNIKNFFKKNNNTKYVIFFLLLLLLSASILCYKLFFANSKLKKINRAIISTNINPMYLDFWPAVAKAWKKIGVIPTLAFIADKNVQIDESLGDVIRIEPIDGIPTSFQAQVIRLLLPALFKDDVCITGDIDMLPIGKKYFDNGVKGLPENSFVVYRDKAYGENANSFPMCYNAAKGSVFSEVFDVYSMDDIRNKIIYWSKKWNNYWGADEQELYRCLTNWKHYNTQCIKLGGGEKEFFGKRIDRGDWKYNVNLLQQDFYVDSHMLRPYNQYKQEVDKLLEYLDLI